jgi:quinol monooxygenase YgiN
MNENQIVNQLNGKSMTRIYFSFKTKPDKNLEFLQAMGSIIIDLHKVKGCVNIDFQQHDQDKDQFYLRIDWQNGKLIKGLLQSKEYNIFEGAMKVLCQNPIVEINDVEHTAIKIEDNNQNRGNVYERLRLELKG